VSGVMMRLVRQGTCSTELGDCRRGDDTTRRRERVRAPGCGPPGLEDIPRNLPGVHGCRSVGGSEQDAGHTARSCFVWPRDRAYEIYLQHRANQASIIKEQKI